MSRRAWFWAAALFAALFLLDALAIRDHRLRALDVRMLTAWRHSDARHALIGPPWALKAVIGVTTLGAGVLRGPLTIAAVLVLALRGRGREAALLGGAVAAGAIALPLLKLCFDRPRPAFLWHLVTEDAWSFPSGHAMGSMILYPLLGGIAGATRSAKRSAVLAGAGMIVSLLIGASRVELGVHWMSDVIDGWLIGLALVCAGFACAQPRRIDRAG